MKRLDTPRAALGAGPDPAPHTRPRVAKLHDLEILPRLGLLDPDGSDLPLQLEGEAAAPPPQPEGTEMLDRHGTVQRFETRWRRFDRTVIWVNDSAHAVRDAGGYYKGCLEVSQDLTHIRKLEGENRLLDWE